MHSTFVYIEFRTYAQSIVVYDLYESAFLRFSCSSYLIIVYMFARNYRANPLLVTLRCIKYNVNIVYALGYRRKVFENSRLTTVDAIPTPGRDKSPTDPVARTSRSIFGVNIKRAYSPRGGNRAVGTDACTGM